MSIWDDPDIKVNDDFVKLENVGDEISGTITLVKAHKFPDTGDVKPQITFIDATGAEKVWTAGQIQAVRKLTELRPEPGDWFRAALTQIERRQGGRTLKHIDIEVRRNGQPVAPLAKTAAGPAEPGTVSPEQLAGLTAAQREAVLNATNQTPPF